VAAIALLNRNRWTCMHPSARRISSCSSVSTPSAVVIMPKLEPSTHDGANDRHAIVVPAKLVNERAINLRDPTRQPDPAFPRLYASARNRRRFSTDRRIGAFELRIADRFLNQATPWQCQPPYKHDVRCGSRSIKGGFSAAAAGGLRRCSLKFCCPRSSSRNRGLPHGESAPAPCCALRKHRRPDAPPGRRGKSIPGSCLWNSRARR
jgi:hypothetical protein